MNDANNSEGVGKAEPEELIAEISAKDMIADGYFSMIRRGLVIEGLKADVPVAVSLRVADALNSKGAECALYTMLMLKTIRDYLITAIKMGATTHEPISMMMPYLELGPVMMVLQPLASNDQRPVLTIFTPEED
jgi:hypothetical protein